MFFYSPTTNNSPLYSKPAGVNSELDYIYLHVLHGQSNKIYVCFKINMCLNFYNYQVIILNLLYGTKNFFIIILGMLSTVYQFVILISSPTLAWNNRSISKQCPPPLPSPHTSLHHPTPSPKIHQAPPQPHFKACTRR